MENKKILVTSALPYVNNIVHLGNIIGCVLSADCYSRFCRLIDKEIIFVGGTDEYGTTSEVAARIKGITPKELCDENFLIHKKIYEWFNISFDIFGRTSTDDPSNPTWSQTEITWDIFRKLVDNNLIFRKKELGLYCEEIDSFVSDRYVTGICPYPTCKFPNANGDQCDQCGHLLDALDLFDPKYKLNQNFKLKIRETEHLYLDLPALQDRLEKFLDSNLKNWSNNAQKITQSWLSSGIKPRCITRDLKWGTPVPETEKFGNDFCNKVFYVWFDAPIGYLSIFKEGNKEKYDNFWKNPKNVELVQFMAKDNVTFHSIIFPSTLIGADDNYTLVSKISSTEYLQFGKDKFSKTRGIGVFGDDIMELTYPPDFWRFYLLYIRPEVSDSCFNWTDFANCINGNLINNFGNLVNRVLNLGYKYSCHTLCSQINFFGDKFDTDKIEYLNKIDELLKKYIENFNNIKILESIRISLQISACANEYITKIEPWKLFKEFNNDMSINSTLNTEIYFLYQLLNIVTRVYMPFIPETCNKIANDIDFNIKDFNYLELLKFDLPKTKPIPLYKKLEETDLKMLKAKFGET